MRKKDVVCREARGTPVPSKSIDDPLRAPQAPGACLGASWGSLSVCTLSSHFIFCISAAFYLHFTFLHSICIFSSFAPCMHHFFDRKSSYLGVSLKYLRQLEVNQKTEDGSCEQKTRPSVPFFAGPEKRTSVSVPRARLNGTGVGPGSVPHGGQTSLLRQARVDAHRGRFTRSFR